MTRIAEIVINNCGPDNEGWEVARLTEDGFYHFGTYETAEKAAAVAEELGEGAIVARLID